MRFIRRFLVITIAIAASTPADSTFGHGNPMHIDGISGGLVVSGGLALSGGYSPIAFDPSDEGGLDFPGATVRTDLPGFDIANVAAGASVQLEILGRPDHSRVARPLRWLWYWNPATDLVADAVNDPDFQFRRKDLLGSISFDQYTLPTASTLTVTDSLTPDVHQHYLRYELDNSPAAEFGVYGVFVRALSPGFTPSAPFLMAFGYGANVDDYASGANAINAAAGLAGDFNVDGKVDGGDFLTWQRSVAAVGASPNYLPADATLDGVVNAADLVVWRAEYGRTVFPPSSTAAGASVPEPAGRAVVACAAMASSRRIECATASQNGAS